ncbi:hypothetical protein ACMGL1_21410, partial [Enterobacter cloacae]
GKNSLNRLIRCVCGKKIGPDPRNFNQRVSLGRNDLLIRTFLNKKPREDIDEEYRYTNGGSYYSSRPVWRSSSSYVWRSGKQVSGQMGYTTKRVSTISRGGYGRSSSARGSWGG